MADPEPEGSFAGPHIAEAFDPASAAFAPDKATAEAEARETEFARLTNKAAIGKLEAELKEYIRSIPFRPVPTYAGLPPPRTHMHQKGDPKNIDPYSRSADHRYCLQMLAADIHGPHEEKRTVVPYHAFLTVLGAPEGRQLERLDPHVVEKPSVADDVMALDGKKRAPSPKDNAPAETVQFKMTQAEYKKEMERLQAGADIAAAAKKWRPSAPNMYNFPHTGRGFLVFQHGGGSV